MLGRNWSQLAKDVVHLIAVVSTHNFARVAVVRRCQGVLVVTTLLGKLGLLLLLTHLLRDGCSVGAKVAVNGELVGLVTVQRRSMRVTWPPV